MKRFAAMIVVFSVLVVLMLVRAGLSQQPADNLPRNEITIGKYPDPANVTIQYVPGLSGENAAGGEIGRLMNQLREADDAKKPELTKQLQTAVDKYFDDDMKARETELTKLEERLSKLRNQLDRRRKAKAEIIQLQIKVLLNEADGLGFIGASFFEGYWPGPSANWISDGLGTVRFQTGHPATKK